jgi:DNA replication protein DnaC
MTPLSESEARDFWEICEDRSQTRSLVLTSQLPVAKWHSQIGDATLAEGILDRIIHSRSPGRTARRIDAEKSTQGTGAVKRRSGVTES